MKHYVNGDLLSGHHQLCVNLLELLRLLVNRKHSALIRPSVETQIASTALLPPRLHKAEESFNQVRGTVERGNDCALIVYLEEGSGLVTAKLCEVRQGDNDQRNEEIAPNHHKGANDLAHGRYRHEVPIADY